MALPSLVDLAAFAVWLRRDVFVGDEATWAQAVLDAASTRVRSAAGQTWTEGESLVDDVPDAVTTVTLLVAARAWRNPAGVIHDVAGPYSARYAEAVAQVVFLTDSDLGMLAEAKSTARPAIWTLGTTRSDLETGSIYVDVVDGEPMPWYQDPL